MKIKYRKEFSNYLDQEKYVGIEGYSTTTPGTNGKIKQNIADFIVREITPSREILSSYEEEDPKIPFIRGRDQATLFTLVKKNTDTIVAAGILQKYLNIPRKDINWAGIKDHTAITAQKFSVKGNHINKLKNFHHRDINITNIRPARHELDIGYLWGNHFMINVREVNKPYDDLQETLKKWEKELNLKGFPNFYGMQRFGQHRPNSHVVGKAIFQRKFKDAIDEFLFSVYPAEYDRIAKFRTKYGESRNYKKAIKHCPRGLQYEKEVLYTLATNPNDYEKGVKSIRPALLNLILSSYQSYLFNKAISRRINNGDPLHHPIAGDIISILKDPKGQPSLVFYKYDGGDGWNDSNIEKAFELDRAAVIAPIVGYKTEIDDYPAFNSIYKQILDEEQFDIQNFRYFDRRLLEFGGTFRAISNRPTNLEVKQAHIINKYPKMDPNGVRLEFSLPKGTYATLLLRELRKPTQLHID